MADVPAAADTHYPAIESFVEVANRDDLAAAFKSIRDEIANLKGPKAEQGKKAIKAVERTEELMSYLIEVREKLEAESKGKR